MGDFEWALTNAFNSFFEREGIKAIAYRLKQSRFASQLVDILVDSRTPEYYLAIECKSLDARKTRVLYFKQHFSTSGGHQLSRESEFISRSGRKGILAVELRWGAGRPRSAYFLPWGLVYQGFQAGRPGIRLEEICANPPLERRGGSYDISSLDIVRISGYYDLKMESFAKDYSGLELDLESDRDEA